MNTMEITKIVAGLCGALLIYLMINWATEVIYHSGEAGHGEAHAFAYPIEAEGGDDHGEDAAEEPEVDFGALMAAADAASGEKLVKKCAACHKLEAGVNNVGPSLYGVVGRDIASADGYKYSGVLSELEGNWTPEALSGFLENPKAWAKGTKMVFKGFKDPEDRADIIAYIDSLDD